MQTQGRKLIVMLGTAVGGLHRPSDVVPAIRALGERHQHYGVTSEHYATVGAALLWTLEQGLGEHWTPAMRSAWEHTYRLLADTMLQAAGTAQLA